jgi:C-terminal processing protease CtpA/Prc
MAGTLEKTTGMKVAIDGKMPRIESIKSGSPAYEAGLKNGDLLVSVWSKLTGYLSLKEILDLLVHKSAIEIRCVIGRCVDVPVNQNRTPISSPEDLIGASLVMEFDGLTISSVKEEGSAISSGLQKGDLIMAIGDNQTRYMPLKRAIELIRNSKGSAVKLAIRRKVIIWRRSEL